MAKEKRETLNSRLGFLFLSAGCAVGLGNVWRFPYITGKYGGALFLLLYVIFLFIFGLPVMIMEFSVGRASKKSIADSFHALEPKGSKWHLWSYFGVLGNYLLMFMYTTIAGWMLYYFFATVSGKFFNSSPAEVLSFFEKTTQNPTICIVFMLVTVFLGMACCFLGLQKGVERVTKIMMSGLFILLVILVINSFTLKDSMKGVAFLFKPDFSLFKKHGIWEIIYAALGQAFFTLSLGIGAMAIFGSYIDKSRSLTGESVYIIGMDTFVAIMSGLIIFPACASFGVSPNAGPGLVFVTLPNIFNQMTGGRIWGSLFFLFMSFAALTTVIAVFENIVAFPMDKFGITRKKSVAINFLIIAFFSIPCALGFNVLSNFQPLGKNSTVLDLEDFIISNNLLPIGALIYILFCCSKHGWNWDNFIMEANTGKGLKFPKNKAIKIYLNYIVPLIFLGIFIAGYIDKFAK
ncbi:MAG: sodium-dependent transporter [Treponemataceae bacterium]